MTYTAEDRRRVTQAKYKRRYTLMQLHGIPTSLVPAQPVIKHLRTLYDLGWSSEAIGHLTNEAITHGCVTRLMGQHGPTVQRSTAAAVLALPITVAVPTQVPDTCLVPALGAVRRVQALMRLGWNHGLMRERYGFDTTSLARSRVTQMAAWKWRAVAAMYDELSMTLGPSPKTATYARNYKFHPPLQWRDVDDPNETPKVGGAQTPGAVVDREVVERLLAGVRMPSTRAEKDEAMRRWVAAGNSRRSLAVIHGWQDARYGRDDGAA